MIIIHVVTKVIKWTVIVVAYLLVGLAKLVTILLVLLFLTGRAGVRRLLETKGRRAEADEPEEYDLGYPAHVGRPSASRHERVPGCLRRAVATGARSPGGRTAGAPAGGRCGPCGLRAVRRRLPPVAARP